MLALFACGSAGPKASSNPGVFHKSDAGTVRVYPGSQATGPAKSSGDTLTQTYTASANPADISRFYTNSLPAWVPVEPVSASGTGGQYMGAWEHSGERLQVTTDNPARDAGDNPSIRYTLTLQGS